MKKYAGDFFRQRLVSFGFGPLVLAVVYLCLQKSGVMQSITVDEASLGIFSTAVLAFVIGGAKVIYDIERLPIMLAVLLHGSILYVSYITVYLINGWLKWGATPVLVFTVVFVVGYLLIMALILTTIKRRTARLNKMLQQKHQQENSLE